MRPILAIGISILIFISCTGSPGHHNPRYTTFPQEKAISSQVIPLDTILFRYPFRVTVRDSIAIVMDLHNIDHYFHAFTYPGWKHLVSFGHRGEAPEEMLSAETFQFNSLDSIWALDANKMQITRWSISPTNHSAKREEEIKLDAQLVRSLDFYAMDSCFLIPDYLGEHRYSQVNYEGKLTNSFGSIPSEKADKKTSPTALAQAWRSFIDYNPDNGIFAMVTQLGEVLEIYNLKDSTHIVQYGPEKEPQFKTGPDGYGIPTGIMGFSDVQVTDNYIYTVFQGIKFKDKLAAIKRGETPESGGRYIYVFDLKGNPVCKYKLDRAIQGIHVNEKTNTIIATDAQSDDPILEFKI